MRRLGLLFLASQLCACPDARQEAPPPRGEPGVAEVKSPPEPDWQKAFEYQIQYDGTGKALVVDVKIAPGYHAYTVGETIGKPLNLTLDDTSAYTSAGEVKYPEGETKDLPIGRSVIVEGAARIVAPVQKKQGATDNHATGTFRWQVCTEDACDRPRTKPFSVDVPS